MHTRLKYQTCPLHDQPMNLLCLHSQCQSDRVICAICRQQRHPQSHFILPLKIYISHKTQQIKCLTKTKLTNIQNSLIEQKINIKKMFKIFKQQIMKNLEEIQLVWDNIVENRIQIINKCEDIINKGQIQVSDMNVIQQTVKIVSNYTEYQQQLEQQLIRTKNQFLTSISNIKPSQSYTKQKWIHHQQILPLPPANTILKSTTNSYKLAYLLRPISKKFNSATFRFLSSNINKNKWILFGVCDKNIVQKRNYTFKYYTIGHGVYGISCNSGIWSHDQSQLNNKLGSFIFEVQDTVVITYDFNQNKVQFQNQHGNKINLKVDRNIRDNLHFCVVFYYEEDQVEIISEFCNTK